MEAVEAPAGRRVTLSTLLGLASALVGFGIGAQKLGDNSFLTHLATGRRMIDEGVVREDAFTWTSNGESLVVQSWLASLLYGIVDELGGFGGLRLLMAATAGVLGWLVWRLTERSPSVATRFIVVVPVLFIGLRTWSERPLLLAFVFLASALVVSERGSDPRWLVVIGVLWVNVHGSWPLGIVLLAARWFGALLWTWLQSSGGYLRALEIEDNVMFIILSILVLIAAMNIVSGLIMLVKNKGRDIGILRTMGLTEGSILRVFFLCGAFTGIIGTAMGVILGCLFAIYIEPIFSFVNWVMGGGVWDPSIRGIYALPAELHLKDVLTAVALSLGLSFVVTWFPARRAARMNPVEALRYE